MSKRFYTADPHHNHPNICKVTNRPWFRADRDLNPDGSWKSQEIADACATKNTQVLLRNANARVSDDDIVICVGDYLNKGNERGVKGLNQKPADILAQSNGTWIFVEGNHDCFSSDTRLLTSEGYKSYDVLKVGDMIPTMNMNTRTVEYKPILKVFIKKVSRLHGFKTKSAEGLFSAGHELISRSYAKKAGEKHFGMKKVRCSELFSRKSPIVLPSASHSGNPDHEISDDLLKFLGWIYTDGGIKTVGNYKQVSIYQSKPVFIEEIKSLLSRLGVDYRLVQRDRKTTSVCGRKLAKQPLLSYEFHLRAKDSQKILSVLGIEGKYEIPEWIKLLSDRQTKVLIDEMVKGDGSITKNGTKTIWGQKFFLEKIMGIGVTHGIDCNLIKDARKSFYLCVHKNESLTRVIYPQNRFSYETEEIVWCVNVENHTLFTELNGKPLISGNCNNGVKSLCNFMSIEIGRYHVGIQHIPLLDERLFNQWNDLPQEQKVKSAYKNTMTPKQRERAFIHADYCRQMFDFIICGHVHNKWQTRFIAGVWHVNVGVDANRYMPISDSEVLEIYEKAVRDSKTK